MENRHFNVIVIGENPELIMEKYDLNKNVSPYIVYKFKDAAKYKEQRIHFCEEAINSKIDTELIEYFKEELEYVKGLNDMDFYVELTEDYDLDEKTGDAMSNKNPNGKYDSCNIAKRFAIPFVLKDGTETYSARKSEIDWGKMHLYNRKPYEIAWDTVMEHKVPENDDEKQIYENMKERSFYFSSFGDRETYVNTCTAFWGYAFVDENNWVELDEKTSQLEWVNSFYDKFIKNLPGNTLITIFECIRK